MPIHIHMFPQSLQNVCGFTDSGYGSLSLGSKFLWMDENEGRARWYVKMSIGQDSPEKQHQLDG